MEAFIDLAVTDVNDNTPVSEYVGKSNGASEMHGKSVAARPVRDTTTGGILCGELGGWPSVHRLNKASIIDWIAQFTLLILV